MTRIAFTSCCDPIDQPEQDVWDRIAEHRPDHLVLLGDQIYMDYGFLLWNSRNPSIGKPAGLDTLAFAQAMHLRYAAQWKIIRRSALAQLDQLCIHGIWDDHDFAWNNSHGDSGRNDAHGPGRKRDAVPRDKQRVSRRLMRQYFDALRTGGAAYPSNPVVEGDVAGLDEDLSRPMRCIDPRADVDDDCVRLAEGVRLLLTDGRSFRTARDAATPAVFGDAQWAWIRRQFAGPDVLLFASATPLRGKDALDDYVDYLWLTTLAEQAEARLLCLTGDAHECDWPRRPARVFEAVASGAARELPPGQGPLGGIPGVSVSGNYGLLDITTEVLRVSLYAAGHGPEVHTLDRARWKEI